MQARVLTLLIAAVTGCCLPAQDLVTVSLVAGPPIKGRFAGVSEDGALQIQTRGESLATVPQDKIVTAVFSEVLTPAQRGAARIHMVSGDTFVGAIEGGDFDEIAVATQAAGSFRVFLDHVSMVVLLDHRKSAAGTTNRATRPAGATAGSIPAIRRFRGGCCSWKTTTCASVVTWSRAWTCG